MSPPAKSTFQSPNHFSLNFEHGESSNRGGGHSYYGGAPRVDCPQFDGVGPRAWKLKCETYFRVSGISPEVRVGVAVLQFVGSALIWLQSTRAHEEFLGWTEFSEAVCVKFGREEFQGLVRQFNRLKQTGSVSSYAEKFCELMHNLHAHHTSWNTEFSVTQFIDGLRADIRSAVIMHRPTDLDTAVDLACLQEEVLEYNRREGRRVEFAGSTRMGFRPGAPAQPRPGGGLGGRADDRRATDDPKVPPLEDKLAALRAYRRAKGLCHTCGERWSRDHKCGPTVQLHVMEELWELLESEDSQLEELTEPVQGTDSSTSDGELCKISREAVSGTETSGTLRLQGWIQQHEVLILVDSGSSHSFISETLASRLTG